MSIFLTVFTVWQCFLLWNSTIVKLTWATETPAEQAFQGF